MGFRNKTARSCPTLFWDTRGAAQVPGPSFPLASRCVSSRLGRKAKSYKAYSTQSLDTGCSGQQPEFTCWSTRKHLSPSWEIEPPSVVGKGSHHGPGSGARLKKWGSNQGNLLHCQVPQVQGPSAGGHRRCHPKIWSMKGPRTGRPVH